MLWESSGITQGALVCAWCEGYKNYALGNTASLSPSPIPRLVSARGSGRKGNSLVHRQFFIVVVIVVRLPRRCSLSTQSFSRSLVLAQINSHSLLITAYNLPYYLPTA